MKKALLAILISTTLVTLGILPIASVSCEQAPATPKMTAIEVCQYANQMLPGEHVYQAAILRYEYRYTAVSAQHLGEGMWQVSVRVTVEPQRLYEGQWMPYPGLSPQSTIVQYLLNETTGALTKR